MPRSRGFLPVFILCLGLVALLHPAESRAAQVSAGSGSAMAGQIVDIAIETSDLTGLGVFSFQFNLAFSSPLLSLEDVLEQGTLSETWGNAEFHATSGQVTVSHAGAVALAGAGTLLNLRFRISDAALSGGYTGLTFQSCVFNEGTPAAATSDGSVSVLPTPMIEVAPNTGEIVRGETLAFTVSGPATLPISWSTTDPAVATISAAGILTGIGPGRVRVVALDAAGLRDTTDAVIQVLGVGLTLGTASVHPGEAASVAVTVTDVGSLGIRAGQFTVAYDSSAVTPTGLTTAGTLLAGYGSALLGASGAKLSVGFAGTADLAGSGALCVLTFTTRAGYSGTSDLILSGASFNETLPAKQTNGSITVIPFPSIGIDPATGIVLRSETTCFTASGGITPPLQWSTDDPSVATIDASGCLTAQAGGTTRIRVRDAVGATGASGLVEIYDVRVSLPTIDVPPDSKAVLPLAMDRDVSGLGIYSFQYTLVHDSSAVSGALAQNDLSLAAPWGSPTTHTQPDRISVADAGSQSLGGGSSSLQFIELTIRPGVPIGTDVPLTFSDFQFNEGRPRPLVVNGLLRIRDVTAVAVALLESGVGDQGVHLRWHLSGANQVIASVERRAEKTDWVLLGSPTLAPGGRVEYLDSSAESGVRYGYRLRVLDGREVTYSAEAWVDVPATSGVPRSLMLAGSSPNPIGAHSRIRFGLARSGPASLTVHDVTGRLVAVLAEGYHAAGWHTTVWACKDGRGRPVASGCYFLRLESQGDVRVRRVAVLR